MLAAAQASGRGLNAFAREHAASYGRAEGRELFDPIKYLQQNQTLPRPAADAYDHYNQFGRKEGRAATYGNVFDPNTYLMNNPDVQKSGMDPRTHWLMYGQKRAARAAASSPTPAMKLQHPAADLRVCQPSPIRATSTPAPMRPRHGAGGGKTNG